jgi:hypothetical protein
LRRDEVIKQRRQRRVGRARATNARKALRQRMPHAGQHALVHRRQQQIGDALRRRRMPHQRQQFGARRHVAAQRHIQRVLGDLVVGEVNEAPGQRGVVSLHRG